MKEGIVPSAGTNQRALQEAKAAVASDKKIAAGRVRRRGQESEGRSGREGRPRLLQHRRLRHRRSNWSQRGIGKGGVARLDDANLLLGAALARARQATKPARPSRPPRPPPPAGSPHGRIAGCGLRACRAPAGPGGRLTQESDDVEDVEFPCRSRCRVPLACQLAGLACCRCLGRCRRAVVKAAGARKLADKVKYAQDAGQKGNFSEAIRLLKEAKAKAPLSPQEEQGINELPDLCREQREGLQARHRDRRRAPGDGPRDRGRPGRKLRLKATTYYSLRDYRGAIDDLRQADAAQGSLTAPMT